jgi:Interferon-induced transmembrane protein
MTEVEAGEVPRTYLWWAVAATAVCFFPLGVVAVIFAIKTMSALERGDLAAANTLSRLTLRWLKITVVVGIVLNGLILLIFGFMGAFSS